MPVPPNDASRRVATGDSAAPVAAVHSEDLALAREILAGSRSAWDRFLRRYSGLLWAVIRRYLPSREGDQSRTIFAELVAGLYRHKLSTYEGRASLSTWLTLAARTSAIDYLRSRFGRRTQPRGVQRLSAIERGIFRMYYVEGRGFREVMHEIQSHDPSWTVAHMLAALGNIEANVDERSLRRIAYDLHAQSSGASSGRLQAYLDHVREEFKLYEGAHSPEYYLLEREARRVLDRVRELIEELPLEDRRVYALRFERGWSAQQIAEELGLPNPRGAYTLVDRVVRGLRRRLKRITPANE